MIYERYTDVSKLITNVDELQLMNGTEVIIYREDKWHNDIVVDLESQAEKFEELKSYIVFIAQNLSKMDTIVQKYSADNTFADNFEVTYIYLNIPDRIQLEYCGTIVNTQFDVVFQHINGKFILKKFGMVNNIPPDWDNK